jgi:Zn-dependent protease with chaperone function
VQTLGLGRLATLDNTYTTVFFESGALGLMAFLAVGSNVLVGHRWAIRKNLHWYSILSLLVAGFAFTTIYYATFNLIWVASVATLAFDTQGRSNRRVVPS